MRRALDAGLLLEQARRQTGLADFGDAGLPAQFGLAVELINAQALDEAALAEAEKVCLWLLTSRLELFEDFKRYPIAEEVIDKPVFATGEGRSGTTLLHALLSVDPNARSLRFSEVMYPSPPPGLSGPDDPRYARADADWRDINTRLADWLPIHPYNDMLGNGLPECERTWAMDFRQMTPTAWWRVPMASLVGRLPTNEPAQYRLHKMMLQQFQYARPKKTWVLKGFHQDRMRTLFETYPDARVIWTHRDPVQVIASTITMSGSLTRMLTGSVDWKDTAARFVAGNSQRLDRLLADPILNDPRIHHVRYADLVRDPIGSLRSFYETYDMPFGADTEQAMRDYLAGNRSDRHGKFHYSTDVLNTDVAALHDRFAPYRERFGLEVEQR